MPKISYMGDGTTTEFNFNFPYFEDDNIIVTKNNESATGYTIVGTSAGLNADIPYTGGKVVFDVAPTDLDSITISRSLPLTRIVDYQPTEKINPTLLNQDINYTIEVLKDMSTELNDFHTQYASIIDKESTQNLLSKITNVTNKINEFDDEIENGRIMSKNDFYSYATNCLTAVSQDIKLELSSGTLTLKTGSKLYKPNGANAFDVVNTTQDLTFTSTTDGTYHVFLSGSNSLTATTSTCSGASEPGSLSDGLVWYDTTNNVIKRYYNSAWESDKLSFPIAIITVSSGAIESIDQIFNGLGYIGSTIFALPGIKGLIPNGRNADGTLNNTEVELTVVKTLNINVSATCNFTIATNGALDRPRGLTYDSINNYNYNFGSKTFNCDCGTFTTDGNYKITSFSPKKVFCFDLS